MAVRREQELVGRQVLVCFRTTHIDRAGETVSQIAKLGEIVKVEDSGWVVADTICGEHIRCPVSKIHPVPSAGVPVFLTAAERTSLHLLGRSARPEYFAAEELVRDFHAATRPITLRWLGKDSAIALCQAIADAEPTNEQRP